CTALTIFGGSLDVW
nr:immunoglobulin heavy chain junction region [Macaca mulatta]